MIDKNGTAKMDMAIIFLSSTNADTLNFAFHFHLILSISLSFLCDERNSHSEPLSQNRVSFFVNFAPQTRDPLMPGYLSDRLRTVLSNLNLYFLKSQMSYNVIFLYKCRYFRLQFVFSISQTLTSYNHFRRIGIKRSYFCIYKS